MSEEILEPLTDALWLALPVFATIVLCVAVLLVVSHILFTRAQMADAGSRVFRQLAMLALTGAALVLVVLSLPVSESTRGQLLSLLGILLSAAIALSSTTLIGNIMAGIMLRVVGNLRPGDFVQVGDRFGRVSERGLLHVEIQTEDRDLVTLPNLYLVSNPVKVVRTSGTIISATVSLGYDIPRRRVEELLTQAARAAGLDEPYVQILDLGDFSITYRACGFLAEVNQMLTSRTRLRSAILDALHGADIEIVSPTFMNQRVLPGERAFIPEPDHRRWRPTPVSTAPEEIVFDKAEAAAELDRLGKEHAELVRRERELGGLLSDADLEAARGLEIELASVRRKRETIERRLAEEAESDE